MLSWRKLDSSPHGDHHECTTPWRGAGCTNIYQAISCSTVGPLIHIRYLWARYKSMSLMIHTMSNYRGSIEVPRVPWLWWSPRVWLLDSEAHLHSRLPMDTVSSVEALNVYISVRSCADRARYADVHWCTTSATSATHQQIDTLTIILFTEVIRVAACNISVSYMRSWPRPWSP